jgi:two-component system sensor histidine kinase BaeS
LTIAIIALVVVTVALTSIGGYVLIRRAAVTTAERELAGEARAISATFSDRAGLTKASFAKELAVVTSAGDFTSVRFVLLSPDGTLSGVPGGGIGAGRLDSAALLEGRQVTGHTNSLLAFSAVPTPLDARTDGTPVLVVTRQIHSLANGVRYFVLVGLAGAAAAALVAAALAQRFTRPLVAAVEATGRVASGDLDTKVDLGPHVDPEFTRLADSINSMGANLVRARDQERQFLLSISHELRTPLTSIRGYADAVIDGATDDPVAAARVIAAESGRLERLVRDLLDLARLDADRFSLDLRIVDAADVVRQVAGGFQPRASELGLTLDLAPGSEAPCPVTADRDRLGQIVANLVENASSFARSRIVVGVAADRGRAVVWVDDDGPGIPVDRLTRVFDRHVTSDRSEGRGQGSGSGLGLAIVSELAAAMGATVHAESPLVADGGTRMVVDLRPPTDGPNAPAPTV